MAKLGVKGLENSIFKEAFEQIGRKLTLKTIGKAVHLISGIIGALTNEKSIWLCRYILPQKIYFEKGSGVSKLIGELEDEKIVDESQYNITCYFLDYRWHINDWGIFIPRSLDVKSGSYQNKRWEQSVFRSLSEGWNSCNAGFAISMIKDRRRALIGIPSSRVISGIGYLSKSVVSLFLCPRYGFHFLRNIMWYPVLEVVFMLIACFDLLFMKNVV